MTAAISWITATFMDVSTLRFARLVMTKVFILPTHKDRKVRIHSNIAVRNDNNYFFNTAFE